MWKNKLTEYEKEDRRYHLRFGAFILVSAIGAIDTLYVLKLIVATPHFIPALIVLVATYVAGRVILVGKDEFLKR